MKSDSPHIFSGSVYSDSRGSFSELYRLDDLVLVQTNVLESRKNVLRGLHFRVDKLGCKLVTCLQGLVLDIVVNLNAGPNFGVCSTFILKDSTRDSVFVPAGYAHGVYSVTDSLVMYQMDVVFDGDKERILRWNDPAVDIPWGMLSPILSLKDSVGLSLCECL